MTTHVVYLTPRGAFLPELRSDTLWGMLCWAIRMVHGEERLEQMLRSYQQGEPELLISSAFLWHLDEKGHRQHTFPRPTWRPDSPNLPRAEAMQRMSLYKRVKSIGTLPEKPFLDLLQGTAGHSLPELETALERQQQTSALQQLPSYDVDSVTHNTIDRVKGGTLSINGAGQLFHVEEKFVQSPVESSPAGLYFLARGKLADEGELWGALRFLEHFGIGGDRSIGKGVFDIEWDTFTLLPTVNEANAQVCLSLYHATPEEASAYDQAIQADPQAPLYYELTDRFGQVSFRGGKQITKGPLTHFAEGSVFPLLPDHPHYGHNPVVVKKGAHDGLEHDVYQYGMAFMLPLHIPQS